MPDDDPSGRFLTRLEKAVHLFNAVIYRFGHLVFRYNCFRSFEGCALKTLAIASAAGVGHPTVTDEHSRKFLAGAFREITIAPVFTDSIQRVFVDPERPNQRQFAVTIDPIFVDPDDIRLLGLDADLLVFAATSAQHARSYTSRT